MFGGVHGENEGDVGLVQNVWYVPHFVLDVCPAGQGR